ncbi:cytochrome c3 family protein [Acidobacteriota bacterium]
MKRKISKRTKIFVTFGAVFLLFLFTVEFTSHSKFCASCHYMKPFYRSWETSSHGDIECNTCHYPPGIRSKIRAKFEGLLQVGRYWSKLYLKSKPWAEIPDESCLREGCHDKRLLEGEVKFKKVVFDHKVHFTDLKRGKRLQCTSCHSQIVQGQHIIVTESSCFICHFKESEHYPRIGDCSHCHKRESLISEQTSRFNHSAVFDNDFECNKCHSNTIMGDGEVPRENCYKCHWETDRLNKYDDTDLMHSTHISSHKIECNQCHTDIQHKIIKDIEAIADCQACHTDYHQAQKILFTGEGGKGVPHTMPNIMLEKGLSCKGCHIFHEETGGELLKSGTSVSNAQACESCHGQGFARILKDWEVSTAKKLNEIQSIYTKTLQEVTRTKGAKREKAMALLEEAIFNMEIVEKGQSVHNISYSQELLLAAFNKLSEALQLIDSSYKPEAFVTVTEVVPMQCAVCHAGIEEINKQIFGLDFSHKRHLVEQKIQCDNCHSNARRHGEFIATKQGCAVCHHKDPKKDCTICHKLQSTFYQGGRLNGFDVPADIMSEADVDCVDCHKGEQNQIFRPDVNNCMDCHEQEYKEMFFEWQSSIKQIKAELEIVLREKKKLSLSGEEKAQLLNIEKTLAQIRLDGSSGIHNYMFMEETLTNFKKIVESFGKSS